jgi:hypothetical protein
MDAFSLAMWTLAFATPGTWFKALSTCAAHEAQVIPETGMVRIR